jgi:hypothetical protein
MLAYLGVPKSCEGPNDYGLPNTPMEHSPLAAMVSNLGMKFFFRGKLMTIGSGRTIGSITRPDI